MSEYINFKKKPINKKFIFFRYLKKKNDRETDNIYYLLLSSYYTIPGACDKVATPRILRV